MGDENNIDANGQDDDVGTGPQPSDATDSAAAAQSTSQSGKGLTPGQRLAMKRDKKALEKQQLRAELKRQEEEAAEAEEEEAERILGTPASKQSLPPDAVQQTASELTHFMQEKRGLILGSIAGIAALGLAIVLGRTMVGSGSAEQAALLASAIEISNGQIDETNSEGKDAAGKPVFKSASDRAAKSAAAFASAVKNDSDSLTADWARLGQASALVVAGKPDEADKLFSEALKNRKGEPVLGAQALEGHAIALEALDKTDEALKQYEELKKLEGGAYKDLAEYHVARIKFARGDREGAKPLLKALYDRLSASTESTPKSRYLKGEVEVRLAEIDSSLVPVGSGEGQQFSPEELQRLIQQMQMQQQQKGGAGE